MHSSQVAEINTLKTEKNDLVTVKTAKESEIVDLKSQNDQNAAQIQKLQVEKNDLTKTNTTKDSEIASLKT